MVLTPAPSSDSFTFTERESGVKAGVTFTLRLLVGVLAGPLDHSTNDIDLPDLLTTAARSDNDAQHECVHEIIDTQRQLSTGLINLVNSVPMNDEARESMTEFAEELAARDLLDAGRLDMIDTASCECRLGVAGLIHGFTEIPLLSAFVK